MPFLNFSYQDQQIKKNQTATVTDGRPRVTNVSIANDFSTVLVMRKFFIYCNVRYGKVQELNDYKFPLHSKIILPRNEL